MRSKQASEEDWYKAILGFDEVVSAPRKKATLQVLNSPNWLVCWLAGPEVQVWQCLKFWTLMKQH